MNDDVLICAKTPDGWAVVDRLEAAERLGVTTADVDLEAAEYRQHWEERDWLDEELAYERSQDV